MIILIAITVVLCFQNSVGINIDFDYLTSIDDEITPQNITYDVKNARRIFENFVQDHNKQYKDEAEVERRFEIFVKNLLEINKMNQRSRSEIYGITKFADLTVEEFYEGYTGLANYTSDSGINYPSRRMLDDGVEAPEELDWRQRNVVTPARDQARCNSCWAFSAVGLAEGQFAIKHGQLLSLSEQQLIDCWNPAGCAEGNLPDQALNGVSSMGGFMQRSEYPYLGVQGTCAYHRERAVVKVQRGYRLNVNDEEMLKNLVYQYGPLSIGKYCVNITGIYSGRFLASYRGRVYIPSDSDCPPGVTPNHAVLLVGYGSENGIPYWIIKNSWGENWGENGFLRIIRGRNACAIPTYVAAGDIA